VTLSRREFLQRSAAGAALIGLGALPTEAGAATLPPAQLSALRAAVRGRVLVPGNRGYNAARVVFNKRFDGVKPPAVVQVRNTADVQAVVQWANRFDVPLVARSGGHAYNGASTSNTAVVVDLGGLDSISLSGGTATIGPGARNIDVYAKLARSGAAIPSGSCPTVGFGGLVLGGGMGLAGRSLGLTLDRVTSFQAVTADGAASRIDGRDEDLFWALRGGGGNFAIVTAVRVRVARIRQAAWFFASWPAGAREEVLGAWDDLAPGAPSALTSICTLTSGGVTAFGQYLGSESALRRLVAPLARVPGGRFSAGTSSWLALQRRWAGCADGGLAACRREDRSTFDAASVYVSRRLTGRAREAFVDAADTGAALVCDSYGGAVNRVPADATAFVHRDARFSVQVLSYAPLATAKSRVRRAWATIAPFGDGEAYQNYPSLSLDHPLQWWYGANLPRLRSIKAAVDPNGRFAYTQDIPAA
jgi:FAD/FMN-containing dehydrogenase